MEPLEVLRNALARTREYLAGKCRPLQQSLLPHKSKFFLKALSLLTFWIPAFAGMTNTGKCSIARHARAGGHPGCLPEALGCKKPTPERSPILLAALLSVLLSPGTPLAVVATPPPAPVLQLGGTDAGYFGRTFGVALDTSGNIYVADHENRRIQKFDAQGNFLSQFPVATDPFALTIANGTVYVAGENGGGDTNSLLKYDLSGNFLRGFGGSGVAFVNVAVDPAGNVYVVEASHGNVLKFAPDGTRLSNAFGGHSGNEAVATDGNYIYITSCVPGDTTYPLQKYDFTEHLIDQWGTASQFNCAGGLAIDSIGDVHIADTNRHRILTFTNNGTLLDQTGSLGQGNGQFYYPWEVAVGVQGQTYVADSANSRVQIFDSTLNFVAALGKSSLYGIYNNVGVSSTLDGHIYVADTLPPFGAETRFSAFDSQGNLTFRRYFFDVLPPNTNWPAPTSLAVGPDGSIYVDFAGHPANSCASPVIAKFDSQLNRLATTSSGCDPGAPTFPTITIDALGLLYLNEGSGIKIFDANLNLTNQFATASELGDQGTIAVDSQGFIYLTNDKNLGLYEGPGNFIGFFNVTGDRLATAPDRSLFVADSRADTLSSYPSASTYAQLAWNLPYTPDSVFVDNSRVYVLDGGGGALVNAVSVVVYPNLFVSSVTPPVGGDTGTVTLTITGRGFQQGATATLRRSGQADINASSATFTLDGTSATAQFNLAGASDGAWDVVVTNPDGTVSTLPAGFTVAPGNTPLIWFRIVGRSIVRTGQPSQYTIVYGNAGNVDSNGAVAAFDFPVGVSISTDLPVLTDSQGSRAFFAVPPLPAGESDFVPLTLTAQGSADVRGSWLTGPVPDIPEDPNIELSTQVIQSASNSFQMNLHLSDSVTNGDISINFSESAVSALAPPATTINESDTEFDVTDQVTVGDPSFIQWIWKGIKTGWGLWGKAKKAKAAKLALSTSSLQKKVTAWLKSRGCIDDATAANLTRFTLGTGVLHLPVKLPSAAGQGPEATRVIMDQSWCTTLSGYYEAEGLITQDSCYDHLYPVKPAGVFGFISVDLCKKVVEDYLAQNQCASPGTGFPFDPPSAAASCPLPQSGTTSLSIVAASAADPNGKTGPAGGGPQRWVPTQQPLPYTVFFTNESTATLPAQRIVITDQIDASKFDLSSFAFGPITFGSEAVSPPPGSQSYATTLDLRPGVSLVVRVNAKLDTATGIATWTLSSTDPTTGAPPSDPTIGFLPPDTTPPNGEGSVTYSVKPNADLTSGTIISNFATIVFDQNAPINTPMWSNTIDAVPPVSHINTLPSTESSANFLVTWSGTDDASGIGGFNIFVSDNGGPFTIWLNNTSDTSNTYPGVVGHTYAFYSIAQDQAGNVEDKLPVGEASTQIIGSDSDGDGVPDASDLCPNTPTGQAVDASGCSCAQKSCDDHNACTADSCNSATAACQHANVTDGTACNDGNACTQTDTCQAGVCIGTNPVVCSLPDQCHEAGVCNPVTGACSNPTKPDGTACNDGNACTQTDTCQGGICTGSNPVTCTASDQCHMAGTCDPATGRCSNPNAPNGTACNDGNACTTSDTCSGGTCVGGSPLTCNDNKFCTTDTCNPQTGCVFTPNDSVCNDNDVCTNDACNPSASGANPTTGCVYTFNSGICANSVTDASVCPFDVASTGGTQFRLIFTPDPLSPSTSKLNASNPGQFSYNVFSYGKPGDPVSLSIAIPYPFVTQGAVPIQVHSSASLVAGCFFPADDVTSSFTITAGATLTPSGAPQIVLSDYVSQAFGSIVRITVSGTVPSSRLVYVTIHLDYGRKGTNGYTKDNICGTGNDADGNVVHICDNGMYTFANDVDTQTIQNNNVFKRDPGIGGLVLDSYGDPVPNVKVQIYDSANKLLATVSTDQDGWYMWQYKYTGKAATFTVTLPSYNLAQTVILKSNGFLLVSFTVH